MMVFSIQYLRAIAVLLVIAHHIASLFPFAGLRFENGTVGVDIFFVISGFIMWITTGPNTSSMEFVRRRLVRIVPLYWLITVFYSFVDTSSGVDLGFHPEFKNFLKSLFFIPFENPTGNGLTMPIVRVGWTLNMEMFFYSIFAAALFLPRAFRPIVISVVFLAVVFVGSNENQTSVLLSFFGSSIIFEFLLGMVLGLAFEKRVLPKFTGLLPIVIIIFFIKLTWFPNIFGTRVLDYGIVSFLLVLGFLGNEGKFKRSPNAFFTLLGNASYSLYLTHKIPIVLAFAATFQGAFPTSTWFAWPVLLLVTLSGGIFCHFAIERPMNKAFNKLLKKGDGIHPPNFKDHHKKSGGTSR